MATIAWCMTIGLSPSKAGPQSQEGQLHCRLAQPQQQGADGRCRCCICLPPHASQHRAAHHALRCTQQHGSLEVREEEGAPGAAAAQQRRPDAPLQPRVKVDAAGGMMGEQGPGTAAKTGARGAAGHEVMG